MGNIMFCGSICDSCQVKKEQTPINIIDQIDQVVIKEIFEREKMERIMDEKITHLRDTYHREQLLVKEQTDLDKQFVENQTKIEKQFIKVQTEIEQKLITDQGNRQAEAFENKFHTLKTDIEKIKNNHLHHIENDITTMKTQFVHITQDVKDIRNTLGDLTSTVIKNSTKLEFKLH